MNTLRSIPANLAYTYNVAYLQQTADAIILATETIPKPEVAEEIAFILSQPIQYRITSLKKIKHLQREQYGDQNAHQDIDAAFSKDFTAIMQSDTGIESASESNPIIYFVNTVLYQSVKQHASDIHFEPFEDEFTIRYRVDGVLFQIAAPPPALAAPVISRIKILADLNIAESRLPQDGRLQLQIAQATIDFRVSTLPTQFGESVVLRILDPSHMAWNIDSLGFPPAIKPQFLKEVQKREGILITTGPTGSGKTTTLYAALQQANQIEKKILTAEDPIEYDIEGVIQLPVHEEYGLTFASALRAFLRHDPDLIMVGEIRDSETAEIAIQAALTGHLVFSSLHTNNTAGAITRLIDLGIEPYLLTSTLNAVLAQRLVRTICPTCKTSYAPTHHIAQTFKLAPDALLYRGTGCPDCNQQGYSGRHPIFEYLPITSALHPDIMQRKSSYAIQQRAQSFGMQTLREQGVVQMITGKTTIDEILQHT